MSLINCSECNKEISDKAEACPNCGNPIQAVIIEKSQTAPTPPVLIEQTSKKWKSVIVVATMIIIIALLMFLNGVLQGGFDNPLTSWGLFLIFIGFITLMVGKFGAWWSHR